jgi:hypothetical protein
MTEGRRYTTPVAFRRALTDRLKAKAVDTDWSLTQLQRQLAYDRLLQRLYLLDDGWIVKGATALLARRLSTRATIDVDVYRDKPPGRPKPICGWLSDRRSAIGSDSRSGLAAPSVTGWRASAFRWWRTSVERRGRASTSISSERIFG